MRRGVIDRRTTETQIQLAIGLEGRGRYEVRTGIRFLDHMLELFARHGAFDLKIACAGDLDVDQHHTVEDLGIALGEAVTQALGDRLLGLLDRRARQRPRQGALRAIEPPPRRSRVQGVRAGAARGVCQGQAAEDHAAEHQGVAVMATAKEQFA